MIDMDRQRMLKGSVLLTHLDGVNIIKQNLSFTKFSLVQDQKYGRESCENCSEIERQNLQTAASKELIGIHHSKRWVACCICRQNSRCLHESSNCPQLDKKQVVSRMNERNEMWQWSCVEWIPFIATPKEREKEARRDKRNCLPQSSKRECECVLYVEFRKYRKKQKHEHPWGCNL